MRLYVRYASLVLQWRPRRKAADRTRFVKTNLATCFHFLSQVLTGALNA